MKTQRGTRHTQAFIQILTGHLSRQALRGTRGTQREQARLPPRKDPLVQTSKQAVSSQGSGLREGGTGAVGAQVRG